MLFIGGLFLSPMSVIASEQSLISLFTSVQADTQNAITASQQLAASSLPQDDKPLNTHSHLTDTDLIGLTQLELISINGSPKGLPITLREQPAKQPSGNESEYAPLVSQRFVSFSQHDPLQSRPQYLLAFEFSSPPIPSLVIGYRIDVKPTVDWSLHINGCSHRLSAWKESNLLYRYSQTRA